MWRTWLSKVFIAALPLLAQAVPVPQPSIALKGRAVILGTTTPVPHATIEAAKVAGQLADYRAVVTDEAGRFTFGLTPGTYRLYAQREGYVDAEYGRRAVSTTGTPVVLAAGQAAPEVVIAMTPTGAIAGRVLDGGKPKRSVWVRALKPRFFDGRRSLTTAAWAESDDRGDYRLFGLAPGLYVVSAVPPDPPRIEGDLLVRRQVPTNANNNQQSARVRLTAESLDPAALDSSVFVPMYHPGTTDMNAAAPVEVKAGTTVAGIVLTIARTQTFHIRGRVTMAGGEPVSQFGVGAASVQTALNPNSVRTDPSGAFDLARVPPGSYFVVAGNWAPPPTPLLVASVPVEVVDHDVNDVAIAMAPGVTVTVRVSFEGRQPATGDPAVMVQLMTLPGMPGYSAVRVPAGPSFTIDNVASGEYRFRVIQPGKYPWIKAARYGGNDVLTAPIRIDGDPQGRQLEILISSNTATLDAAVVDRNQRPVAGVLVVAVPDAARRNRSDQFRSATTDADGKVHIESMAPGEYTVFATAEIEAGAWQDPEVLRTYASQGQTVRLSELGTATVTLRILQ